jgi:hypothetical protein
LLLVRVKYVNLIIVYGEGRKEEELENKNDVRKCTLWNKSLTIINDSLEIKSVIGIDTWPILYELSNRI